MGRKTSTTKKRTPARRSVRTKKSAKRFVSPFRKESLREKACIYLSQKRTYQEFYFFMAAHGGNTTYMLRYFRKLGILQEDNGKVWVGL